MRILGIDPGSSATGYGVVDRVEGRLVHVAHGTLRPLPGAGRAERLASLYADVAALVETHRPDVAAVEQVFVAASPRAALVLGEARGALLAALGDAGLPVSEYAARAIKRSVTGAGGADKRQVQRVVRRSLRLETTPACDAADALAAAICHAHAGRLAALGVVGARRRGRSRGARGWVVRRAR